MEIGATGPNGTSYASSSLASAATTACPPGAPTHLAAAPASQTSISLTWTDRSEDESGFKIERSLNGIDDWEEIATVEAGANSYTDTGLSRGTLYYYRVRAFTAEGSSAYSNIASTSTLSSYTIFLPVIVRSH